MSSLGNKAVFARNLSNIMSERDLSQKELCATLGFSESTFSDWINAKAYPRIDKIEKLSNFFGVKKSDLIEERNILSKSVAGISVPVLGRVAAGIPFDAVEYIVDTEEISENLASKGEFFGLKIKGDSMEPRICNGDVVIVRQQTDADPGDIVIALVNGDDAVCKKLAKYSYGIGLISLNSKYEPLVYTNEEILNKPVKILGKVVELRGKF